MGRYFNRTGINTLDIFRYLIIYERFLERVCGHLLEDGGGGGEGEGREVQGQGGAAAHAGREAEGGGGGGGGGEHRPLQGVGGRGVAVVEVQRGEHGGVWRQCHAPRPRPRPRPGPAEAHGAVHLLEGGHVARLLQQLDTHRSLALPLGPATRGHALTLHSAQTQSIIHRESRYLGFIFGERIFSGSLKEFKH